MIRLESDPQRRVQAGQEALEVLKRVGFGVQDYQINAEEMHDATISLELELTIPENERPLENINE